MSVTSMLNVHVLKIWVQFWLKHSLLARILLLGTHFLTKPRSQLHLLVSQGLQFWANSSVKDVTQTNFLPGFVTVERWKNLAFHQLLSNCCYPQYIHVLWNSFTSQLLWLPQILKLLYNIENRQDPICYSCLWHLYRRTMTCNQIFEHVCTYMYECRWR